MKNFKLLGNSQNLSKKEMMLVIGSIFLIAFVFVFILAVSTSTKSAPSQSINADSIYSGKTETSGKYANKVMQVERFIADGKSKIFKLSEKYDNVTIRSSSDVLVPATYGKKLETYNDVWYDFEGQRFIFPNAPTEGTVITFEGYPVK